MEVIQNDRNLWPSLNLRENLLIKDPRLHASSTNSFQKQSSHRFRDGHRLESIKNCMVHLKIDHLA